MGWTKRQFLEAAYEEIGLAGYIFDLSAEQLQTAARKMDAMIASWNALGIRIGWPIASDPSAIDIDQATGVQDAANEAIYCSLAMRLAGSLGKTVSQETKLAAHNGYTALLTRTVNPIPVQMPGTMPAGQGNNRYIPGRVFLDDPVQTLDTGLDGTIGDLEL